MSYISLIPVNLQPLEQRSTFLHWLRSMPVTFDQRMRIYFQWLDLNGASYTPDEIHSLNLKEKIVEPQ